MVAVYTFIYEKGERIPYRVKILTKSVSLRHVKDFLPKRGAFRCYIFFNQLGYQFPPFEEADLNFCFRFFFKTEVEGDMCCDEES